jgi:hypothetical protein
VALSEELAPDQSAEPSDERNHAQYCFYNSTLRAWFIAFGVGFPALVLSQHDLYIKVVAKHSAWPTVLILVGAGLQVFGAMLNKWTNWAVYYRREGWASEALQTVNSWMWVDGLIDLATLIAFAGGVTIAAHRIAS